MIPNTRYTILIVDDQVSNLKVLSDLLESHRFKVLSARDGEAAIEIAQSAQPDLILFDVVLPGIDGFEACRRLNADELTKNIPVIFMTVLEEIEEKIRGFQVGAVDYITKPFQIEEVLARVTTQLRIRSLTRELQEANETLERRVEERTAQLARVNKDLQAEVIERSLAEEALAAERNLLRTVIDNLPDYIYAKDTEGRFILKNLADVRLMGATLPDEVIGKTDFDYYPLELANKYHTNDQIVLQSKQPLINREEPIIRSDGTQGWTLTSKVPLRDSQGNIVGLVGIGRDITERKQTENAMHRYNQRLSILREIDQHILTARSPDMIADRVLKRLLQLISCEFASIVLYNEAITEEQIFAWHHTTDLHVFTENSQPVIHNQVLKRLKSGQTTVIDDLKFQEGPKAKLTEDLMNQGIHSAMACPLIAQEQLIGTLAMASLQIGFFSPEYQQIAEEIAAQVAIALHQAKLNEQIERHNLELEQRVRERTIQLENANRELELFSYSVSHDLRAPLRAIQGFAEIIARRHRASLNDEGRRYFDHIVTAGEQMDQLITDLLNYARLGRQRLHLEAIPLTAIFDVVLDNLQLHIDKVGAEIQFTSELPMIQGDKTLLMQIFTNLLENALIYHHPTRPPVINVSCLVEDGHATIQIKDNGIGISPEFHEKIFHIFQRLHSSDQYPGTGIGLAIVRRSADMLNGKVWLEPVTEGCLFCVRLPRLVE